MRCLSLTAAALLVLSSGVPGEARAGFTTIAGSTDANLTDPTLSGTFSGLNTTSLSTHGLVIQRYTNLGPQFDAETRAVIEFNIASALPALSILQGLTFNFTQSATGSPSNMTVGIYGYAGTGTIGLADATANATLLGSYNASTIGLGSHSIFLSGADLQSLVGSSGFLALRLQGLSDFVNTSNDSLETARLVPQFVQPPSISVSFEPAAVVPEPSSLVLLCGMGTLVGIGIVRKRRAS